MEAITEFEDAARLLAALRPDLVILDLNLPEISGFQICQELKNKTAIPVLVLTSRDQVKDELQAFQLGADEYLTKPCRKIDFLPGYPIFSKGMKAVPIS